MKFLERVRKPVFDQDQEARFKQSFAEDNVASARLVQGQILLLFYLAGFMDLVLLGELATLMVFLRYYIFAPILTLIFLFSFTPWFKKRMQLVFALVVGIVSCYVSLFTFLNLDITAMLYFSGVLLVVFVSFVYVPILFNYAVVMSVFVFSMSMLGVLYNDSLTPEIIQSCGLLLLAAIFVALSACYSNERSARLNFQYRELLNLEKNYLEASNTKLKRLATNDALTGIPNRRAFDEKFSEEWQRAERSQTNLAVLLIDVDFFKLYNDFYGHQQGDECLKQIAQVLKASIHRVGDFVARYGGEEFVILLPNAPMSKAIEFADKVRELMEQEKINHEKSHVSDYVTLSIGIASSVPGEGDYETADILLRDADRALYQAKSDGRNRVVGFSALH